VGGEQIEVEIMKTHGLTRREFIKLNLCGMAGLALEGATNVAHGKGNGRDAGTRMIILGLDGMDPRIVRRMMAEGKLPNFQRLAREGHFGPLGTSTPPQSPVAWANFITGMDSGGHGIFDFIHRNPATYLPYLSTSRTEGAQRSIRLGDFVIPLSGGRVENLRKGSAFWEILEDHEIPATILRMPSNFPPKSTRQRTLSGMGTPDILGTYGIFTYFTDRPLEMDEDIGGGRIVEVSLRGNTVRAALIGPKNTYRRAKPDSRLDFTVYRDPEYPVAKIVVDGKEILLKQGEWSPWVRVSFPMIPTVSARGMCQFYLKEVHPHFKLYVSPIQIDPADPALPISTPEDYSTELFKKLGPFHTKGLPADTKAMDHGVLDEEEFLKLDDLVLRESLAVYDYELNRFDAGVLFHYISSTDQRSHMFWRLTDPGHPSYDEKLARQYGDTIEKTYERMDRLLEKTFQKMDKRTILMVLSDHGFSPYYRSFHLNSWLKDNGYIRLKDESKRGETEFFQNVDWSRTKAYALGFNGLYVNLMGRETAGIVSPGEKTALAEELAKELERVTDPKTRARPIRKAYKATASYRGPYGNDGPDIVVGYNRGYRASWQTALGKIPKEWLENNTKKWSGDHCMAPDILPGILLINRKVQRPAVFLHDLTATILAAFSIPTPAGMKGISII
jgi:predicted AlkP superfamily phosphohydrolase/phosphomutase